MWNPFRSGPAKPMPPPAPYPWAAALSAVVALVALFITDGGVFIPILIAAILLPGLWTRPRLDDEPVWVTRLVLMGLVLAIGLSEPPPDVDGLVDPRVMGLFGQVCAAEFVVIVWRRRAPTQGLWALPGFVFLAASNTFDDRWVRWLAPPYLLFAALAARAGRERTAPTPARTGQKGVAWAVAAASVLMLLIGAGSYAGVYLYRGPLNELGMKLLAAGHGTADTAGISGQPQMSATFDLRGSLTRVLRIEGPVGDPHLRGQAFDTYRGGRWYPTANERHLTPVGDALHASAPGARTRVIHLTDDGGLVFAPLQVTSLSGPAPLTWDGQRGGPVTTIAPAPWVSEYVGGAESLRSTNEGPYPAFGTLLPSEQEKGQSPAQRENYQPFPRSDGGEVAKPERGLLTSLWPALDPAERARCLSIPAELDPRVARLARQITADDVDPQSKMRDVEAYLLSHHGYSATFVPPPGDPVSGFILSGKPAHCEFFAASAVLLLRCVGVPARYVTGYYAHEGAGANVTVVRGQDAHAWCEAFTDGAGWQTVDATPGGGRPDHTAAPAPQSRKWGEWASDLLAAFRRWVEALSVRARWLLITTLAVVLIVPQIVRARRRRQTSGPKEFAYTMPDAAELQAMSEQFAGWLARMGVPCPAGQTWRGHLRSPDVQDVLSPDAQQNAAAFVQVYSRLRFGPVREAPSPTPPPSALATRRAERERGKKEILPPFSRSDGAEGWGEGADAQTARALLAALDKENRPPAANLSLLSR